MKAVFSSLYAGNLDFYSCLLKADQISIDLTNLSSGVYLVHIKSDSYNETRRILKN